MVFIRLRCTVYTTDRTVVYTIGQPNPKALKYTYTGTVYLVEEKTLRNFVTTHWPLNALELFLQNLLNSFFPWFRNHNRTGLSDPVFV